MTHPTQKYRLGTILIWFGVLAWAPYVFLRMAGGSPTLWAVLPFHLGGVIAGGRLRAQARRELGLPGKKRTSITRVAYGLVAASVLVWVLYFGLKMAGLPVSLTPFLSAHLGGMLSGIGLMALGSLVEKRNPINLGEAHGIGHPTEEPN